MSLKISTKVLSLMAEAKEGGMSKTISKMSHNYNPDFDKLLRDAEHNRIRPKISDAARMPAYSGTKLQKEVEDAKNKKRTSDSGDSGSI